MCSTLCGTNICFHPHNLGLICQPGTKKKSLSKYNECAVRQYNGLALSACECVCWKTLNEILLPSITCSRMRKSLPHTCQSLLHTQVSAGQMLIQRGFSAPCPLSLHWGFASQSTASLSHVLAEQPTGTFYQSAVRDASSGIILTVEPARIRLYDATQHWNTHTPEALHLTGRPCWLDSTCSNAYVRRQFVFDLTATQIVANMCYTWEAQLQQEA